MAAAVRVRGLKMARAINYFKLKYSSLKISKRVSARCAAIEYRLVLLGFSRQPQQDPDA